LDQTQISLKSLKDTSKFAGGKENDDSISLGMHSGRFKPISPKAKTVQKSNQGYEDRIISEASPTPIPYKTTMTE